MVLYNARVVVVCPSHSGLPISARFHRFMHVSFIHYYGGYHCLPKRQLTALDHTSKSNVDALPVAVLSTISRRDPIAVDSLWIVPASTQVDLYTLR